MICFIHFNYKNVLQISSGYLVFLFYYCFDNDTVLKFIVSEFELVHYKIGTPYCDHGHNNFNWNYSWKTKDEKRFMI